MLHRIRIRSETERKVFIIMVLSNIYFKSLINHRVLRGGTEETEIH